MVIYSNYWFMASIYMCMRVYLKLVVFFYCTFAPRSFLFEKQNLNRPSERGALVYIYVHGLFGCFVVLVDLPY